MIDQNQQKFFDACCKVRHYWGLKTSTFEQIGNLIANALHASLQDGVDQKKAEIHFGALWDEWTRWRATGFLLQERKKVAATISRWPNGNHYYVTLIGDGVNISKKFNTQPEAQKFYNRQIHRIEKQGRKVIGADCPA